MCLILLEWRVSVSDDDPYAPPQSRVESVKVAVDDRWQLLEPRSCSFDSGMGWIADGWRLFMASPGIWMVNFVIVAVITLVLGVIPLVSIIGNILGPVFTAGLLFGSRQLDEHGALQVEHLFSGFSENGGKLAGLGALTIAMGIGIALIMIVLLFAVVGSVALTESAADPSQLGLSAILVVLVVVGLTVPILMAYWFAPALIVFHDVGIFDALKLSFVGCLRNMLPFLAYGLVMTVALIVALLPFLLGLLVLVPVIFGSMYASYRDVFTQPPGDTLLGGPRA